MVANILPTDTPLTQGWGQRVKPYIFVKVVMLHIKFKSTMKAYILSLHTHKYFHIPRFVEIKYFVHLKCLGGVWFV